MSNRFRKKLPPISRAPSVTLENTTETLINVHRPELCAGRPCPIHNMTLHHMRSYPQHWRGDRGIMERICPHGIGHPDPDDWLRNGTDPGTHGCDGCCMPSPPSKEEFDTAKVGLTSIAAELEYGSDQ